MHILDVAENSIAAAAGLIEVSVVEDEAEDLVRIEIVDDGMGMAPEALANVVDPFFTTKCGRRTGLGVPMFAQAARDAGGDFTAESRPGGGTRMAAAFKLGHPDRLPLGDLRGTMAVLVCSHPDVHFACEHTRNGRSVYRIDTREATDVAPTERDG